jgi:predicted nucleic acid-binding Zn ribbon protein
LNSALPRVVRSLMERAPMSEGKFEFAWRSVVGPSMERVTVATLREDGAVEVQVDQAAWLKEVKRSQALILANLQELLGASVVKKLKIVGGRR